MKLKSGRLSYWYVNWRTVAEDVYKIDKLSDFLISFVQHLSLRPDCFYGVPEGATKLGVITQLKWAKMQKNYAPDTFILPMGRGKPKEHGDPKDKYFLGIPKGKVFILEDTTTTGSSLVSCIKSLEDLDVEIRGAIVLTDRNEYRDDGKTVKEALAEYGVNYYVMSHAIEILPLLKPNEFIANHIREYFNRYGTRDIRL